jgi:hypothetical protein
MERPCRLLLDLREPLDRYYGAFIDEVHLRAANVAEVDLEDIFLEIADKDYAAGNLKELFDETITLTETPLTEFEIKDAKATLQLGLDTIQVLRENDMYDRNGQLIGRFEFIFNNSILCLYVDEQDEE